MLDRMLDFGGAFDWITPVITFIKDYQNRPSVGYCISVNVGWGAYEIQQMLVQRGVKIWGLTVFDGAILFRTRLAQALYTQYLLERAGIPFGGGVDPSTVTAAQRRSATSKQEHANRDEAEAPPPPTDAPQKNDLDKVVGQVVQLADRMASTAQGRDRHRP